MNQKNPLIALLNVWGIILVVLGHSGFEEPIIAEKLSGLHSWIYSFHMPLFFFISGYLFSLTNPEFNKINPQAFLKKKTLRLIVPYIVLGVIVWGIKYAFSSLSHATRDFSVQSFLLMFIAPGCESSTMGYLWYIVTLFFLFVLITGISVCGIDLHKNINCQGLVLLSWTLYFLMPSVDLFNLKALLYYLPFFLIGINYQTHEKVFREFVFNRRITEIVGGGLLIISVLGVIWSAKTPLGALTERVILALVGIFFSICMCRLLLNCWVIQKYFLPLSPMTYSIYLLSWFGQYAAKFLAVNMLDLPWWVCVFIMFVCGLIVPIAVCKVVDEVSVLKNNKFLRFVIGY